MKCETLSKCDEIVISPFTPHQLFVCVSVEVGLCSSWQSSIHPSRCLPIIFGMVCGVIQSSQTHKCLFQTLQTVLDQSFSGTARQMSCFPSKEHNAILAQIFCVWRKWNKHLLVNNVRQRESGHLQCRLVLLSALMLTGLDWRCCRFHLPHFVISWFVRMLPSALFLNWIVAFKNRLAVNIRK